MARVPLSKHVWLLAACGLVVLVAHIHTTALAVLSSTPGCLLEVRPWLATKYSCVALELNCAQGEFDDGKDTVLIHSAFQSLLPTALKGLMLASCSQLHMPPILQSLSSLQMLKIYNSTIVQWDAAAELRGDLHGDLQFLFVSDTNFSSRSTTGDGGGHLPTGLLGDDFAHGYRVFRHGFKTLATMKIPNLALGSNSISHIPDELLEGQAFWYLMLDGNPLLTSLPNKIGDLRGMYQIGISYTNISTLPDWITTMQYDAATGEHMRPFFDQIPVFASGAPLCEDIDRRAEATMAMQLWFYLDCSTDRLAHMYPIEQEREWRAASQAQFT